jgi:hypothetical protein
MNTLGQIRSRRGSLTCGRSDFVAVADVSFDRPYSREAQHDDVVNDPLTFGSGEYLPFEFPLAYWLEQHDYNDYVRRRQKENGPFPEHGPDEGLLMGGRNVEPVNGGGDWVVAKAEHWTFEGTALKNGEWIPGLVGWEYHGDPPKLAGLEVVAAGTAWAGGQIPQKWSSR